MNTEQHQSPETLISEFVEWINPLDALEAITDRFVDSTDSGDQLMIKCLTSLLIGVTKLENSHSEIKASASLRLHDELTRELY